MDRCNKGHDLDEVNPFQLLCQYIASLGDQALACSGLYPPDPGRTHTSQIISQLIGQTQSNYSRCAMQGVITAIRKIVTLRQCPFGRCSDELCFLSSVSQQPISSWGCQSNCESCLQTPRVSLPSLERHIFISLFYFPLPFQKRKSESWPYMISAWQVIQRKNTILHQKQSARPKEMLC